MARTMILVALTLCLATANAVRSPLDLLMTPWTSMPKVRRSSAIATSDLYRYIMITDADTRRRQIYVSSTLLACFPMPTVQAVDNGKYSKGAFINYKLFVPPALVSEFAGKWDSYIGKPVCRMVTPVYPVTLPGQSLTYCAFQCPTPARSTPHCGMQCDSN